MNWVKEGVLGVSPKAMGVKRVQIPSDDEILEPEQGKTVPDDVFGDKKVL